MVEERAQGLLRLVLIEPFPERQQITASDVRGEGDRQTVVGLPGMDRHEVEVRRILSCSPDPGPEEIPFGFAESLTEVALLVEPNAQGEMAEFAPHRHPFDAVELSVLRCPLAEVAEAEADAAVVREEPRVAFGHGRLGGLEVRVGECLCIRPTSGSGVLEFERGPGQGRREFLEVGGDEVLGDGERVLEFDDEFLRVERNLGSVAPPGDAGGIDDPVFERQHTRSECVPTGTLDAQFPGFAFTIRRGGSPVRTCVAVRGDSLTFTDVDRMDESFVGEFGQGFGDEVALHDGERIGVEMGVWCRRRCGSPARAWPSLDRWSPSDSLFSATMMLVPGRDERC